ncbi:MAG: ABC transporter ATP-binding protein [Candidatus Omnitrophota bacterium]
MNPVIEIKDLIIEYGKKPHVKRAVNGLSFSVNKGEIFGFLGPNGAGKTSTIKTLLGLIVPSSGSVALFGKPITPASRSAVGFMPETANYYWYLTPRELLAFYGQLFGIKRAELAKKIDDLLALVGLVEAGNSLMKTFSKGMFQRVSFAQSLINDPEVLILDEPVTGLDPIARMKMRDVLINLKKQGATIFFSSHELSEVETISDRVVILKNGKLLKEASPKDIIDEKGSHVSLEKYFFDLVREN